MQEISEEKPKRPEFLKALCILSFIGGGFSMISYGFMFLYFDEWVVAFQNGQFDEFLGILDKEAVALFLNVGSKFFFILSLLFSLSVVGVYFMWKLRKTGFHMYSIAQILILIVQQVFLPSLPFPLIPFLITLTFILLYYRNLTYMR